MSCVFLLYPVNIYLTASPHVASVQKPDGGNEGMKKEQIHVRTSWGQVGCVHSDGAAAAVQQPGT